jgi:hypothetical protein
MDVIAAPELTAWALGAVQPIGTRHMAKAFSPTTPAEERVLSLYRERNGLLDRIFYNVEPQDQAQVVAADHDQGSIIVVDPDPVKPLQFFHDPVEFLEQSIAADVAGISLSGVGSSSIGAVGLARDVAAVKQVPVAAIVSGYGLDDVVYEGMGGWLFLRETNRLEFAAQQVTNFAATFANLPMLKTQISLMDSMGSGPDLFTLKCLLRSPRIGRLRWVVGHSKGNLLISSAISELVMEGAEEGANLAARLAEVRIVLFGALSALPPNVGRQHQIIGDMDALGWTNSRLNIVHKLVRGAMHHLNPQIPFAMPARKELALID